MQVCNTRSEKNANKHSKQRQYCTNHQGDNSTEGGQEGGGYRRREERRGGKKGERELPIRALKSPTPAGRDSLSRINTGGTRASFTRGALPKTNTLDKDTRGLGAGSPQRGNGRADEAKKTKKQSNTLVTITPHLIS